jgi:predicted enzyme related to lactoylglutathione lyase
VASAKSFYSDVLGWETGDQPIGAFTYTVMRSADAGDEQRSAASCRLAGDDSGPSYAPVGFEVADCDVAAASW